MSVGGRACFDGADRGSFVGLLRYDGKSDNWLYATNTTRGRCGCDRKLVSRQETHTTPCSVMYSYSFSRHCVFILDFSKCSGGARGNTDREARNVQKAKNRRGEFTKEGERCACATTEEGQETTEAEERRDEGEGEIERDLRREREVRNTEKGKK